ncbi:MAG: gliding motility-associated C-terminal domain-containing protein [Chitinophagaceae bacterium]|nr:gliding motility-associated C-terminal domain-containing protein [Chitinophagaceae bacterium]
MMKKLFGIFLFFICSLQFVKANHLKGGWIQYEYVSTDSVGGTHRYKITVRQYLSCSSTGGQIDQQIYLGIFDGANNNLLQSLTVPLSFTDRPSITTFDPCINPPPAPGSVCYRIDAYVVTVNLPFNSAGYFLAVQRCCRIAGINNVVGSSTVGVTYFNSIPSNILGTNYSNNNSPVFQQKDTVIICKQTPFTFDFSAVDADGDSLSYSFCEGLHGGSAGNNGAQPNPPANPPYQPINYIQGFSGSFPLGPQVTINSKTGLITGVAPANTGDYVIAVCVMEYRNGINIGITKKEIHINVANCQLSAAELNPTYVTCNGFDLQFQNESTAGGITSYKWYFGDGTSDTVPTPQHTYADTGVYNLRLIVATEGGCRDSADAIVRVFPGFVPNFTVTGYCFQNPFNFRNTTFAQYGFVDSLHWDFGETTITTDTSTQQNPSYTYSTPGQRRVLLYARSSKGCEDTVSKVVNVLDKPSIILAFRDTLICSIDSVPLNTQSNGTSFSWSPNYNIINRNSLTPVTFPKDTTTYVLTVSDNGCVNKDSVTINVLDFITVDAGANANVCLTDTFTFQTNSFALSYLWTPSATLNDSTLKFPKAVPVDAVTKYYVKANLGKCQDSDSITLFTYPYPQATAFTDTSICRTESVMINGTRVGENFEWFPTNSLNNPFTENPIATPDSTTQYIFTVFNSSGCLKRVSDTVTVNVVQPFSVNLGNDTSIVINQPLQLFAQVLDPTNKSFLWSSNPSFVVASLNDLTIQNPTATFQTNLDSVFLIVKAYTKENCAATDQIKITVFKTAPEIFVPSAFTPNGDGRNDVIKPLAVGLTKLDYFNIYNRLGQLIYTTSQIGTGWDGRINGKLQDSGTFIYTTQGVDFNGKTIIKKGTIVLIR